MGSDTNLSLKITISCQTSNEVTNNHESSYAQSQKSSLSRTSLEEFFNGDSWENESWAKIKDMINESIPMNVNEVFETFKKKGLKYNPEYARKNIKNLLYIIAKDEIKTGNPTKAPLSYVNIFPLIIFHLELLEKFSPDSIFKIQDDVYKHINRNRHPNEEQRQKERDLIDLLFRLLNDLNDDSSYDKNQDWKSLCKKEKDNLECHLVYSKEKTESYPILKEMDYAYLTLDDLQDVELYLVDKCHSQSLDILKEAIKNNTDLFIDTEGCMIVNNFFIIQMMVGKKVFIILAHEFKNDDTLRGIFESMSIRPPNRTEGEEETQKKLYLFAADGDIKEIKDFVGLNQNLKYDVRDIQKLQKEKFRNRHKHDELDLGIVFDIYAGPNCNRMLDKRHTLSPWSVMEFMNLSKRVIAYLVLDVVSLKMIKEAWDNEASKDSETRSTSSSDNEKNSSSTFKTLI